MKVGASFFFQNYFRAQKPDWQIYDEDMALADMVEPLGFDSIWGVEHHFSPYTMIPDVLQFLTFMAGRTKTIGFGSMVVPVGVRIDNMAHPGGFLGGRLFALPLVPQLGSAWPQFLARRRFAVAMVCGVLVLFGFYLSTVGIVR